MRFSLAELVLVTAWAASSGCGDKAASPPEQLTSTPVSQVEPQFEEAPSRSGRSGEPTAEPSERKNKSVLSGANGTNGEPVVPPRGLVGRWLLKIVLGGAEVSQLWMVEITGEEAAYTAKIIGSNVRSKVSIRDLRNDEDRVSFELALEDQTWSFRGVEFAGRVQGTVELRDRLAPAWFERTRFRSMMSIPATVPAVASAEFIAAQRADDPKQAVRQMLEFVEQNPTSTLIFDAFRTALRLSKRAELSEEDLRGIIEKYQEHSTAWGERWAVNTVENIAYDLAMADGPEQPALDAVTLEFAAAARAALPENAADARRQSVELAFGVALVHNDRAEEGKKVLSELRAGSPSDVEVHYFYALAAAETGDLDTAIDTLVVVWPHPLAARELQRVWRAKHGSLTGLEERLDETYLERYPPIAIEPFAGRQDPANNQIVLVELFTGTNCPPCVAADAAFEALGRTFSRSDAVLLQYHLHVPGPDPLTNADTEARAKYYHASGTPFLLINGEDTPPVGGSRQKGPERYAELRELISKQLERRSSVELDLEAAQDGEVISLEAKVSGVEPANQAWRLRLALVEERVRFTGLNGVRLHDFVARAMPGGPDGVPVTEPTVTYRTTIDLIALREQLATSLADLEQRISAETANGFEFPSKPLELNHLAVVAFLQHDATQQVIQSAFAHVKRDAATNETAQQ